LKSRASVPTAIYEYFAGKEEIIEAIAAERHAEETALITRLIVSEELSDGLCALAGPTKGDLGDKYCGHTRGSDSRHGVRR
jgi:AcrR family transcriptional regulator